MIWPRSASNWLKANVRNRLTPISRDFGSDRGQPIDRYDMERWGDYWRFTDASACRLFEGVFGPEYVTVETHGNMLTACCFLHGLATHEVTPKELDYYDPDYQLVITVQAIKQGQDLEAKKHSCCNRVRRWVGSKRLFRAGFKPMKKDR